MYKLIGVCGCGNSGTCITLMQMGILPIYIVSFKWLSVLDFLESMSPNLGKLVLFPAFCTNDAKVVSQSPSNRSRQCPGKEVMVEGESSYSKTVSTPVSSSKQEALTKHLVHLGFEVPCAVKASLDAKDPEESEDPNDEDDPEEFPTED
ncbi:hypothetical protein FNV43_RR02641 [Rhamnella rubrinervis]|uniref:Uncharacterized protein n=1 Tax=Rhamnella rubrinervis TaxID=2594499 RepID=A0A8K0HTW4_9ROSA|nr:hypothetical protein FNV43_RR02641 [Rhamnella rubrinervis]